MSMKDITDAQVLHAMLHRPTHGHILDRVYSAMTRPHQLVDYLHDLTGQPYKVCLRAAERTMSRAENAELARLDEWGINALSEDDRIIYLDAIEKFDFNDRARDGDRS